MQNSARWTRKTMVVVTLAVGSSALRAQSVASDSDMAQRTKSNHERTTSLRVLPVIGSAPETGFVGGATALRVSSAMGDTITRASTEQLYAAYTAKQQFRAFVSTDRWSTDNKWGVTAQIEYQRFPQPFFGIGIDAPEEGEEWYEARSLIASGVVRRKISGAVYAQLGYRYVDTKVRDPEDGGVIERGELLGSQGGVVSQAIGGAAWDTRDNVFGPRSGLFVQTTAAYSASGLGSDYRFGRYTVDARRYLALGRGVLAGQAYAEATAGNAPFDELSLAGSGMIMRGYARGRYRDRDLAAAQLEYRVPIVGRLGAAMFAGAGTVAPSFGDLGASTLLPSVGAGARWLLLPKQRTTIRVDYGVGRSSSGLYIAFNEAF